MSENEQEVFRGLQQDAHPERIVIIGGGIVGSALAYFLSRSDQKSQIILIDDSLSEPQGSTAFAPGFVGQLNSISHLTEVAKRSVAEYSTIEGAFQPVGGLEIASTEAGIEQLYHRQQLAQAAGLSADILTSEELAKLAPDFHAEDQITKGLYFGLDGTADPKRIAKYYRLEAEKQGLLVLPAKVSTISCRTSSSQWDPNHNFSLSTDLGELSTKLVIFATGIWTAELVKSIGIDLPIIPVAHPYAYGPTRPLRTIKQPFVRWPERHIYARDHGEFDGFGSYDHQPIPSTPDKSALVNRMQQSDILDHALTVFPEPAQKNTKVPYRAFNAMFSVTPDSLPFAGKWDPLPGLFFASAVWITHAAGVARLLADLITEKELAEEDIRILQAFNPMRFDHQDEQLLKERALVTYNDIYNKHDHLK